MWCAKYVRCRTGRTFALLRWWPWEGVCSAGSLVVCFVFRFCVVLLDCWRTGWSVHGWVCVDQPCQRVAPVGSQRFVVDARVTD